MTSDQLSANSSHAPRIPAHHAPRIPAHHSLLTFKEFVRVQKNMTS
ncbi:hypothetical protein [Chroococcidiopsis sp.]